MSFIQDEVCVSTDREGMSGEGEGGRFGECPRLIPLTRGVAGYYRVLVAVGGRVEMGFPRWSRGASGWCGEAVAAAVYIWPFVKTADLVEEWKGGGAVACHYPPT